MKKGSATSWALVYSIVSKVMSEWCRSHGGTWVCEQSPSSAPTVTVHFDPSRGHTTNWSFHYDEDFLYSMDREVIEAEVSRRMCQAWDWKFSREESVA